MLIFGAFEMFRMVLVYTTIANASRAGARYAIVHGSDATVATTAVQAVVKGYLSTGSLDTASAGLSIPVTYCSDPSCSTTGSSYNVPGDSVRVTVTYPYDPWVGYFPWGTINLNSTTEGVITY
jgi:Flp pilus assembly protein TadG